MEPVRVQRIDEGARDMSLTDELLEVAGAPLAGKHLVAHGDDGSVDGAGGQTRTANELPTYLLITNPWVGSRNSLIHGLNYEIRLALTTLAATSTARIREEPRGIGETIPTRCGCVHSPSDTVPARNRSAGDAMRSPAFQPETASRKGSGLQR